MNRQAVEGMTMFLEGLGIDLTAEGMEKTPERVVALFEELFRGRMGSSRAVWGEIFSTEYKGLIAVTNIPYYSVCEHHLMPFFGVADVIYQPHEGCVAGLSKIGDIVDLYARRPQLQERLTREIADSIERDLLADGVMVRVTGTQLCMLMKGEFQPGTKVTTLESRGILSKTGALREEALAILGGSDYVQTPEL